MVTRYNIAAETSTRFGKHETKELATRSRLKRRQDYSAGDCAGCPRQAKRQLFNNKSTQTQLCPISRAACLLCQPNSRPARAPLGRNISSKPLKWHLAANIHFLSCLASSCRLQAGRRDSRARHAATCRNPWLDDVRISLCRFRQ